MQRTAVINVVGLTNRLISAQTPRLRQFVSKGEIAAIRPALPAVTCTAQSTYLTGALPSQHGIVANGWYHRELAEVQFWKQSNHLVHGRKIWEDLRQIDAKSTCAKLFWWYNMYSSADWSITPRPIYPADGRKVFDIYTNPASIRTEIKKELGDFPFPAFWGPAAGQHSPAGPPDAVSRWIAASARWLEERHAPTLSLIYLPHLDYNLQRLGPGHPAIQDDLSAIDAIVGELLDFYHAWGLKVIVLSEYGITPVSRPVHLNRIFREQGWLAIKDELGLELLDCGASRVFAVADHQVAHIYINDRSLEKSVRALIERTPGVGSVLGGKEKAEWGLDHARAGDLVAMSDEDAWFTYYYWMEDGRAPDFARTVDIHRKPGYDPVELFVDPKLLVPKLRIARRLIQKKLGFRMLMDVIPLDATLVKGSHGIRPASVADYPVIATEDTGVFEGGEIPATEVYQVIRSYLLGK